MKIIDPKCILIKFFANALEIIKFAKLKTGNKFPPSQLDMWYIAILSHVANFIAITDASTTQAIRISLAA